ncbi:hypothetical protein N481_26110 [Pseudoalteromonas luteoviolacea S4047-1]|uniref:Uncharacterized protein n=1 Tax=Pseudoalteromonas luteoviolacea S4054 TaxID=1129367 RepID=A0A0F6AHN2_9GAMM|nr:hypothetical protein N479_25225 [Pseudoalteromonas luteoviolacea S4054]KZN78426.1 hypothetical protein N481_26110 [Pseudoalteromonas luteoviolacea S4047-1]
MVIFIPQHAIILMVFTDVGRLSSLFMVNQNQKNLKIEVRFLDIKITLILFIIDLD